MTIGFDDFLVVTLALVITVLRVIEKSLETEFPGISFRNSLSGREAYLTGHRVAVWEVLAVHEETKSIEKTASHFRWPRVLVKRALAYAKAFPEEIHTARPARGRKSRRPHPLSPQRPEYQLRRPSASGERLLVGCRARVGLDEPNRLPAEVAVIALAGVGAAARAEAAVGVTEIRLRWRSTGCMGVTSGLTDSG
jgi:uncharacterized protein (DUF433 family)